MVANGSDDKSDIDSGDNNNDCDNIGTRGDTRNVMVMILIVVAVLVLATNDDSGKDIDGDDGKCDISGDNYNGVSDSDIGDINDDDNGT